MKLVKLVAVAIGVFSLASSANAVPVIIDNLDIRGTGIFGFGSELGNHQTNVVDATLNDGAFPGAPRTPADPIDVAITYSNLDLDGDFSANDSVTFTVRWTKVDLDGDGLDGGALASFGQGMDTGFGNLNDIEVSVINVSGTTTDTGDFIVFDGFTGANLGAGGNTGGIDRNAEVNGTLISFTEPDAGDFIFFIDGVDFAPTPTVTLDNSGDSDFDGNGDGGVGSIVGRSYDFQFSTTDQQPGLPGDINGDGNVNGEDLLQLQQDDVAGIPDWEANYGTMQGGSAAASSVPEPGTLVMLSVGSLGLLRRRTKC